MTKQKYSNQVNQGVDINEYRLTYIDAQSKGLKIWLNGILAELEKIPGEIEWQPSVKNMAQVIEEDGVVRMYVQQMLEQSHGRTRFSNPDEPGKITTIDRLLDTVNHIITHAPKFVYSPDDTSITSAYTFPLSSLFNEMMATNAGEEAFRNAAFNGALNQVLNAWCHYLDSEASTYVLNKKDGWLSPQGQEYTDLNNYVTEPQDSHLGFTSYNDFFHRKIKPELRPIASPDDSKVIVSPSDGTIYQTVTNIQRFTDFWAKGQTYSLSNILNNDHDYIPYYEGGTIIQTFLSGNDYHRVHAPVTGTVVKKELVPALTFSQRNSEKDEGAGTESLGYEASVNTRALLYIEADDPAIGTVCVIPIGITEISSIRFYDGIDCGKKVTKGEELGYFSYGGSTLCTLFKAGVIKHFVSEPGTSNNDQQAGSRIKVNAQIATAN